MKHDPFYFGRNVRPRVGRREAGAATRREKLPCPLLPGRRGGDEAVGLRAFSAVIALVIATLLLAACSTPKSSRIQIGDFEAATAEMVNSLSASDFLAQRGPDSPAVVIVINKVENLTYDVITPAEQWMLMAKLEAAQPVQSLRARKNVRFMLPPEEYAMLKKEGIAVTPPVNPPPATHVMSAVFRSSPRLVRDADANNLVKRRQDYYLLQYTLTNIQTRQVEWSDKFEFKREAVGLAID